MQIRVQPGRGGTEGACAAGFMRVGIVLSAGGLRGAAHVGVLEQLVRHGVPTEILVGVSAGAIVAAYYSAVGLGFDELRADATTFRGRHLLAHSLSLHLDNRLGRAFGARCGVIPERLRQLEQATFDCLSHGVDRLGIACHDLREGEPRYFGTGLEEAPPLADVVKASASIPHLFPPIEMVCGRRAYRLTDGGISDPVPVMLARALGATHIVVSDCRWVGSVPETDAGTVWIRPQLTSTGTLWSPRHGLLPAVEHGEAAVTAEILSRIDRWFERPRPAVSACAASRSPWSRPPATPAC